MVIDIERRIKELEHEIELYRELLSAVCVLYEASKALDGLGNNERPETLAAWDSYWDATEDLFDFVRDEPQKVLSA